MRHKCKRTAAISLVLRAHAQARTTSALSSSDDGMTGRNDFYEMRLLLLTVCRQAENRRARDGTTCDAQCRIDNRQSTRQTAKNQLEEENDGSPTAEEEEPPPADGGRLRRRWHRSDVRMADGIYQGKLQWAKLCMRKVEPFGERTFNFSFGGTTSTIRWVES
jgi:hypothetical protein